MHGNHGTRCIAAWYTPSCHSGTITSGSALSLDQKLVYNYCGDHLLLKDCTDFRRAENVRLVTLEYTYKLLDFCKAVCHSFNGRYIVLVNALIFIYAIGYSQCLSLFFKWKAPRLSYFRWTPISMSIIASFVKKGYESQVFLEVELVT